MAELSAAALAYVRFVLAQTHMSPTALAKKAKISSTTLTRALNDPKHKFALSTKTLEKIATATGIDPAGFMRADDSVALNAAPLRAGTFDEKKWEGGALSGLIPGTMIAGGIMADYWHEFSILDISQTSPLDVRSTRFDPKDCFGLIVHDDSADIYVQEGEYLYCIRTSACSAEFLSKMRHRLAIVERRSKDGFKYELTARMITSVNGGWLVHFVSRNKKLRTRDAIHIRDLNGPELRIIGLVDWILRNPDKQINALT